MTTAPVRRPALSLFRSLAIYGAGDVATSLVSLLLLPVFTRHLSPADYGVITMLLTVEAVTKVVFRWGVDTAFMRLFYDCRDDAARQALASTLFLFLVGVNGSLVAVSVLAAGPLSAAILGSAGQATLLVLTVANTFVAAFYFIPYHALRIGNQPGQFIALTFTRSIATVIARLVFVIWAGWGVFGIVFADIAVTTAFTLVLSRWFAPYIRLTFSTRVLRDALRFGLPRIPHSLAQQVISVADRYFLKAYGTLTDVGLYSIGTTFGLALKLFLSAFESAWTPFFLGLMHEPDARQVYSRVSTYVLAVLVLLVAGLSAVAPDLVALFTAGEFHGAAIVTPWIAVGVLWQGVYLVGSIGLVIAKRTTVYPVSTGIAAGASLLANMLLIPRYGMLGAAWANAIAYATLAIVTVGFSTRIYPIAYEWGRLIRIAVAGAAAFAVATAPALAGLSPWLRLPVRAALVAGVYAVVLALTRFFHAGEWQFLREVRARASKRRAEGVVPVAEPSEMAGEIAAAPPDHRQDLTAGGPDDPVSAPGSQSRRR